MLGHDGVAVVVELHVWRAVGGGNAIGYGGSATGDGGARRPHVA